MARAWPSLRAALGSLATKACSTAIAIGRCSMITAPINSCRTIRRAASSDLASLGRTPCARGLSLVPVMSITPQPIRPRPGSRPRMRIVAPMPALYPVCSALSLRDPARMRQHGGGDFPLAHDHLAGAELSQVLDLGIEMGAGHDVQRGVRLARLLHDLPGL